ncbi:phage tail protein [Streptomyces phaeochromogenes]|uniref:phage tail protein n=1 Tax=Streptomyces phaeochromogenes TaxID=1923 RepID=UPI0036BF3BDD
MTDAVNILITANSGQAVRAFRDVNGHLRDMRGRFVAEGNQMSGAMNRVAASLGGVKGSIVPLAAAAAPLAAAFVPIAAKAGGASLAVAAFGAAVAGQVSSLKEAGEAQKAYESAVAKSGAGSKQAADAQRAVSQSLASMPEATARAAVGLQTLKGQFQDFSDSTARFTMAPVERSFAVLGEVIPKLTPMVKGTSEQLDRLVSVAGGAVASPGFDEYADKVSTFANAALKDAVDGIISFSAALASGDATGPVKSFMDYANENGPALRETLSSVGDAVSTLVEAAADAGPGMLTLVNAAAGLVASLPPELVTILMQTAVALKAVSLAGAGAAAIAGGVGTLGARIAAMGAASTAAGGGLAGMNAALNTLGTGGKAMLAAGAVGALALVMHQLSDNKAPVAVDELTTSLNTLATTGQVTGALKGNFDEMSASIAMVSKGASDNKFLKLTSDMGTWLGIATGPSISDAIKNVDAWDEVMANNVKAGNPKLAAAQYEILRKAWLAGNGDLGELKEATTGYSDSLEAAKFEQEQTAESMGVFGTAAQDTSAKLAAQRSNADALRASIFALNDVNRSAYDAQLQFEAGLDSLTASFKEHGATLDEDTAAGQANGQAMSSAAKAHDEMIVAGVAANETLGSMTGRSEKLRTEMMRLAVDGFGGNKQAATEYVNTLLGTPESVKTAIKVEREGAIAGLHDVQTAIEKTPGTKSVKVDTLSAAAIGALEAVGLKTKQLPDGKTQVTTANGQSLGSIGAVSKALRALNGRTAKTYTTHTVRTINEIITKSKVFRSVHDIVGSADGNIFDSVRAFANGGEDHSAQIAGPTMRVWAEPETGGEAYIPLSTAKRPQSLEILEEVADRFGYGLEKFAKGGVTKSEKEARKAARGDLTISNFGQRAGYKNTEFVNAIGKPDSVGSLVSALNSWRSTIMKSTHGRTESRLLTQLNVAGRAMIKYEKNLTSVNKSLEKAKDKLDNLKDSASQLSGSVKSGILSGANITKAAGGEGQVTINTLLSQMQGSAGNAKQFSGMLTSLKKKGLSKDLIAQIGEAGIDGGGMETAAAVLGGGSSEIKKLNELQKQIGSYATAAGKTTADAMYGAGIKAAEGLVKGLDSQKKKIESQMLQLAKYMEKSIKKALGIKSPSTVMEEVGDYTAEGFAVGIEKNRSVQPAWASMLNVPQGGRAGVADKRVAVASSPGVDRPIVLNVSFAGREFGQIWMDVGRKEVSTRGGLRASFAGME